MINTIKFIGTDEGFTKVDYRALTNRDNSVGFRVSIIK